MSELILIIDDTEANRYSLRYTLSQAGYRILEASTGQEGLDLLSERPELILLDIKLPDANGFNICMDIKKIYNPAVILTSAKFTTGSDHLKGIDCGADAYLVSPIDPQILLGTVKSWLKVKLLERENIEAKEKARLNEERLELALSTSGIGFWDLDIESEKLFLSELMMTDWGIDKNSWGGKYQDIFMYIHPEDRQLVKSSILRSVKQKEPYDVTYRILKEFVGINWIHAKGKVFVGLNGKPERVSGTVINITQKKFLDEAIVESERQFRMLAESMPQIVWTATPDGFVDWYNKNWYDYTGATFEVGWENDNIIHPDDLGPTQKRWNESVQTGSFYETEIRVRRKSDGQYRWHLARAVPIKDKRGRVTKWFGTNTDMHEKIEAEKVLERQNDLFKKITEAIPQGIWRTNLDGSADYFSQSFSQIVGHSVEEMLNWGWFNVIHPEDQKRVEAEWSRCRELSIPVSVEFRVRQKDESYKWFLSLGNPYYDDNGNIVKYYGTWTNIDDQKQAQVKLSDAINARDEFLSIASHELKTPLTSLKLQAQVFQKTIQKKGEVAYTKERVNDLLDQTEKQSNRLNRLVDDMLDISRIRTGKLSINITEVVFNNLIQDTVRRMQLHTNTDISLTVDGEDKILLQLDSERIEQVITNLITNAVRYGKGKPVKILVTCHKDAVDISVTDEGIGISPENLSIIFDRFERAVSANEVSGLGLGLYISREILLLHGGNISVESELDKGSTFTAHLPKPKV